MKKINLSCGIEVSVSEDAMNNMELLDALAEMEGENPMAASTVVLLLLGKQQRKLVYDALRTEDGRVPVDAVSSMVGEIFAAFGEAGKN